MASIERIRREKPEVAEAFLNMVNTIRTNIVFDEKTIQLHSISILTALKAFDGVGVHTESAIKAGAKKEEIVAAILLCLPTCGIGPAIKAIDVAMKAIDTIQQKQA